MSVAEQIAEQVGKLTPAQQVSVLAFARSLGPAGPQTPPGAKLNDLLAFAGSIAEEDLREIEKAIAEGCEQVNSNGW